VTAVPAYAGFALTGGRTRQVRVLDANDTDLRWADLTTVRTTLVFLNGAARAGDIASRLVGAGVDPATPIAIVTEGTTVDQRTIASTLDEVSAMPKQSKAAAGGLVVVGERWSPSGTSSSGSR
jgi:siroheme synthase